MIDNVGNLTNPTDTRVLNNDNAQLVTSKNLLVNAASDKTRVDRTMGVNNPWLLFTVLVVVGAIVTSTLSWAVYYWVSGFYLPPGKDIISDQSLASYVGSIFGTSVALAGSFVAIMLAKRSLELAEMQNSLGKRQSEMAEKQSKFEAEQAAESSKIAARQTELAEESVRISERQSPEAEAATNAAEDYRQLKGMLITFPAILRKAQRDGAFGPLGTARHDVASGQAANVHAPLTTAIVLISDVSKRFLEGGAPAAIISLAKTIDNVVSAAGASQQGRVQDQRYFEFASSSLYYESASLARDLASVDNSRVSALLAIRDKFFRVLHGIYHFVDQADDLICLANEHLAIAQTSFPDHDKRFAQRSLAIAELNRHLSLDGDFNTFRWRILAAEPLQKLGVFFKPVLSSQSFSGVGRGGLVFCLHESGLSELITEIKKWQSLHSRNCAVIRVDHTDWTLEADKLPSDVVPIFLIAETVDVNLCRLANYLTENLVKWSMHVAIADQVDHAFDTWTTPKYLTMNEALEAWRSFKILDVLFNEVFDDRFTDTVEDFLCLARPTILNFISLQNSSSNIPLFKPGAAYRENLLEMCEAAAIEIGCPLLPGEANFTLSEFETVFMNLRTNSEDFLNDENLSLFYERFHRDKSEYRNMRDVVRELAKPPLLQRPLYAFNSAENFMMTDARNLALPNTTLFGTVYLNSEFEMGESSLVPLLASGGTAYYLF